MAAAEAAGTKVIGVDVDQSGESETVITSAMKGLGTSVYDMIAAYYNGSFPRRRKQGLRRGQQRCCVGHGHRQVRQLCESGL